MRNSKRFLLPLLRECVLDRRAGLCSDMSEMQMISEHSANDGIIGEKVEICLPYNMKHNFSDILLFIKSIVVYVLVGNPILCLTARRLSVLVIIVFNPNSEKQIIVT